MATNSNINALKNALKNPAKPNKYRVVIAPPPGVTGFITDSPTIDILVKSVKLPGKKIGETELWSQGRSLKVPSDTEFETESEIVFYNDANHVLRSDFITWMNSIDDYIANTHTNSFPDMMTDVIVEQIDAQTGAVLKTYTLHDAWVSDVSALDFSDEDINKISETTVKFTLSSWE